MATLVRGENFVITVNGKQAGCSRSCNLQINTTTLNAATKNSGSWKEAIAQQIGWTASIESLLLNDGGGNNTYSDLFTALTAMDIVAIGLTITDEASNTYNLYGAGIITALGGSGQVNNVASTTLEIQGTGSLATFPPPLNLYGANPSGGTFAWNITPPVIAPVSYEIEYGVGTTPISTLTTTNPNAGQTGVSEVTDPGFYIRCRAYYGGSDYSEWTPYFVITY